MTHALTHGTKLLCIGCEILSLKFFLTLIFSNALVSVKEITLDTLTEQGRAFFFLDK